VVADVVDVQVGADEGPYIRWFDAQIAELVEQRRALLGGPGAACRHLRRQSAVDEDVSAIVGLDQ